MNNTAKAKFFTYVQNNSGGSFKINDDRGICEYVIIEAVDSDHANQRAEDIGLYFYGCVNGIDCPCCGDRWSAARGDEGEDIPSIYGKPVENMTVGVFRDKCYIHYLNGVIKKVEFKQN